MKAVSVLEHFSDHDSIHQKLKKNTASVYSIAQLGSRVYFSRPRLSSSPLSLSFRAFFSSVVARSSSLSRLLFDLLPAWLIFVQAVMSLSVIFALLSLSFISVILMRFLIKFEVFFIGAAFVCEAIISVIMFLGVSVFGGMCYNRSWLQYPSFNHLSWAYGLAVVSMFFHMFAAAYLYADTKRAQDFRRRASNLVYNMQPRF
ncbi:uncharacterized protein TNCV_1233821 [Trichonephila clavipes]|nr:uncharacterized protein TNCV_1233821 [Trichonephila clavipes]